MTTSRDQFPTDAAGLPAARPTETVELRNGDRYSVRLSPVAKQIGGHTVRMLAYNGSVPGPTLRVVQGSQVVIDVLNEGDLETTVHWHGLRLDNRDDGTPETQQPIPVGGSFTYRPIFPDPGIYWYHPHVREDYGQEVGLYGTVVVAPSEPGYWPQAHRELSLVLDDVLIADGNIAPFSRRETTHVAMGRFGNVLLANGETDLALAAKSGEVIRLYVTNSANARVFRFAVAGASMKLVGGDSGRVEREQLVDDVTLAPSERAVVDVLFEHAGTFVLEHRTPGRTYALGSVTVGGEPAEPAYADVFREIRADPELTAERGRIERYLGTPPDKTLALIAEMDVDDMDAGDGGYICPMHPEVTSERPDRCPTCGMKLVPAHLVTATAHERADEHGHGHAHDAEGIEWEDDMVEVNRITTPSNTRWKLVDRETGAEGTAIDWQFRVGDQVKIRLVNELESDHPMHHPFHVHGAGRFLVLARDGAVEPNLAWKDTVLVPTGQEVDILLDVTNPGIWMAHCHIAEHHESGMMLTFTVEPSARVRPAG